MLRRHTIPNSNVLFGMTLSLGRRSEPWSCSNNFFDNRHNVKIFPCLLPYYHRDSSVHGNPTHQAEKRSFETMQAGASDTTHSCSQPKEIQDPVVESYNKAWGADIISLSSRQIPQKVTANSLRIGQCDPFELRACHFRGALLNDEKRNRICKPLCFMISKVLNAANWIAYAADHDLRADDIRALIYEASALMLLRRLVLSRRRSLNPDVRFSKDRKEIERPGKISAPL